MNSVSKLAGKATISEKLARFRKLLNEREYEIQALEERLAQIVGIDDVEVRQIRGELLRNRAQIEKFMRDIESCEQELERKPIIH